MSAFDSYIASLTSGNNNLVPFGGIISPVSTENSIVLAAQIKGGSFSVPDLNTLADIPFDLLELGMSVTVNEFVSGGVTNPRTRYYLYAMPPDNTRVSQVSNYIIANYWRIDTGDQKFNAEVEVQYAPNYQGQKPLFLPTQITSAAYQAGYPTTDAYIGGNPSDIIWSSTFTNNALWMRQRIAGNDWGIPISINQGNYSAGQYINVIFLWQTKGNPYPPRPVQPNDNSLPAGWQQTPGTNYATQILTQDLYRSQAVFNAYGVIQSDWDIPILVSTDPQLTRYGNQPGNTDFLNDTYWRGYYTPGLDTFQATRPNGSSTNWTVSKIDQESGEYSEFVFKEFPIGTQQSDLIAATPTAPEPLNGLFPNDWQDAPFDVDQGNILYMSKAVKFSDGSLKKPWSVPARFDGLDTIQAVIEIAPGDTFFQTRDGNGNLNYAFSTMTLTARLYQGPNEITSGITSYTWYYGSTAIIFSSITNQPTNLGGLNSTITASTDRKTLTITPGAVSGQQQFQIGILHPSRTAAYNDSVQVFDSTDDSTAFVADILAVSGTTFKNQTGLYQFNATFLKGGVQDTTNVVFTWSIKDTAGNPLTGALRNSGGSSIGDTNVAANTVYVEGSDISQYAVLILTATYGTVVRTHQVTLTDVQDGAALEALYWGTGSVDPGPPTDFSPRTLTSSQVLALSIGYTANAAGTWYFIQRISGIWSQPIQMRSESARPNGGIALNIFKNVQQAVDGTPPAPNIPSSGSLIPAGWTQQPTAFTGGQDTTYMSSAFFVLRTDVNADPTTLTRDNYNPVSSAYGTPIRLTGTSAGTPTPGTNGWSPIYAVVPGNGGVGQVLQLIDWTGGTGTKPAAGGTASYVGTTGLTTIGNAINIQGAAGAGNNNPPSYVVSSGLSSKNTAPTTPINSSGFLEFAAGSPLTIQNLWTSPRTFVVMGEIACQAQPNQEVNFCGRLYQQIGGGSKVVADTVFNCVVNPTGNKVRMYTMLTLAAGASATMSMTAQLITGSSAYYGGANIMAFGV